MDGRTDGWTDCPLIYTNETNNRLQSIVAGKFAFALIRKCFHCVSFFQQQKKNRGKGRTRFTSLCVWVCICICLYLVLVDKVIVVVCSICRVLSWRCNANCSSTFHAIKKYKKLIMNESETRGRRRMERRLLKRRMKGGKKTKQQQQQKRP